MKKHFFEYSFKEKEPNQEFFDSISESAELHCIADIFNWDDGTEVLEWIISSPICDQATAKLIFWRCHPSYFTTIDTEEEAGWALDEFRLLKKIIHGFEAGLYKKASIYYDPKNDLSKPYGIDYRHPNEKWIIPKFMKLPCTGTNVTYELNWWEQFLYNRINRMAKRNQT